MNLYNPTSNDLYGYTGGNKMNTRDKIAEIIMAGTELEYLNDVIADRILSTPMTQKEVVEWAKQIAKYSDAPMLNRIMELPSGERVEVEK